jgi:hypothetical protein
MMKIHPLFAGFVGQDTAAVGAALGFDVRLVTTRASLLPLDAAALELIEARFADVGGAEGYSLAGSWQAPGVHCLMFAKPLTPMALAWWLVGLRGFDLEARGPGPAVNCCPFAGLPVAADLLSGAFDCVARNYAVRVPSELALAIEQRQPITH